jgi:TRAP-type C4-dicarboxylate transport system substrate-binding protein
VHGIISGIAALIVGMLAVTADAAGTDAIELRICLDTAPNHLRNLAVRSFADRLEAALPGRFHVRIFDSGQLYNDRDAAKALIWGDMEMALPSILQLARFEPAANVTSLPMFYGLPPDVLGDVLDNNVGPLLAARIEARLPVVVLAPSLDLGYIHLFSTRKPLRSISDVGGLKVRVAGGAANLKRLRAQGANPVVIPWSDTPLSLSQGNIDAISSTYETLQSASLWDAGINFGYEERGMFIQYVPLVRRSFWESLDPATQSILVETWRSAMASARAFAVERQDKARAAAIEHGVTLTTPDWRAIDAERTRLMRLQEHMVLELRVPPDVVTAVDTAISEALARRDHDAQ